MKLQTKNFSRRFVIGDIHGCSATLKALVKKLNLQPDDAIFFVGDYIDRGPDSSGVIDFLIELKQSQKNVFCLRGNHEQNILDAERQYPIDTFRNYVGRRMNSGDLIADDGKLKQKYKDFFMSLPYYFELEDFFVVHAGFKFSNKNFLEDTTAMLEIRGWECSFNDTNGKRIVHGHQPHYYKTIQELVKNKNIRIPVDNGCVYLKPHKIFDYKQLGRLCCVELNSFELICQKNIEPTN